MPPVITYSHNITQGGQDLVVSTVSNGVNASYGDWTGVPNVRRSIVDFFVRYVEISHVVNTDNSITVTFTVQISSRGRTVTNSGGPNLNATTTASVAGEQFWNITEPVTVASTHPGVIRTKSVTVPPLGSSWQAGVYYFNTIASLGLNDEFSVGMNIYNPNPPDYRPGQRMVAGVWQSHNRSGGVANKRAGGAWSTMRTSNGGTGTGDPPYLITAGVWRNQRKIGANAG